MGSFFVVEDWDSAPGIIVVSVTLFLVAYMYLWCARERWGICFLSFESIPLYQVQG